ncbi:MAG: argininosuccinate lyase, partial [Luminiphilus sp.]|nr:argininosuccinate lyase [Luminiphilus sp.]
MSQSKKTEATTSKLWGGRFAEPTDAFVQRFTASEAFDRRLASQDIRGSIAHA